MRDSAAALGAAVRFVPMGARALKSLQRPIAAWHLETAAAPQSALSRPLIFDVPAVAVLPLQTSGGEAARILAEGIVDDLIAALGSCAWFPVIARQSSFIYRNSQLSTQQIARELGAEYVIQGKLWCDAAELRVSLTLIEGQSGRQIWAGDAGRRLEQFQATQSDLLIQLVSALDLELQSHERRRAATAPESSGLDAYGLVQRGYWHLSQRRPADHAEALRLFGEATALAPNYAQAHAALAWSTALAAEWGWTNRPRREVFDDALALSAEAVRLAPQYASIWHAEGEVRLLRDDGWDESLEAFREAIALNPSNVGARARIASPLACTGQPRAAIDAVNNALRLSPRDPRRPVWMFGLSLGHLMVGEHEQALAAIRHCVQSRPHEAGAYHMLAISLAHLGRRGEAADAYRTLIRLEPDAMERGEYFASNIRDGAAAAMWLEGLRQAERWASSSHSS